MHVALTILAGVLAVALAACAPKPERSQAAADWPVYGGANEDHYSPLAQINEASIGRLGLAWVYDVDTAPNAASAPVAADGVLYFSAGHNTIHALDARTGKPLWKHDTEAWKVAGHKMRSSWGMRGIAYAAGKIFTGTVDGRLVALDAKTGAQAWSAQTLDPKDGGYITGAPWIAGDKVVIGFGGADFAPVRGYVTAYDIATGKQAWRFYTVPGDPGKGPDGAASDPVMPMAAKTWTGDWWKWGGGGTVWNAMAYDPETGTVFIGTGNGAPWNQKIRSPGGGDNLFLCALIALDAKTGKYRWHYQINPGESWDYNAAMDMEFAELEVNGKRRSVIMTAPKNGFFYVLDRRTGELLSAEKFMRANWADRIDLKTGRPVETAWARFPDGKAVTLYPSPVGAHSAEPMAYSPASKLVYIPAYDQAKIYLDVPDLKAWRFEPGQIINNGIGVPPPGMTVPPGTSSLMAWDPAGQRKVWSVPTFGARASGVLATGGGLVFQGQADGLIRAHGATTGKVLWSFDAQNGILAQPITYSVGGKQYVTVMASWRGSSSTGRKPEWDYYTQKRRVLTFALDANVALPVNTATPPSFADDKAFVVDAARADAGKLLFATHCAICHGGAAISGGGAPDLRRSGVPLGPEGFKQLLHEGFLRQNGMPQFEDLTDAQIGDIQHHIRQQARLALASTAGGAQNQKRVADAKRLDAGQ
jgi:quinohemoprotein ethanol dehydrogenase